MVEKLRDIRFIQTRLTPDTLVFPSGRRLEPWDKTAERIAMWSTTTRPMRMGDSLEPIFEAGYFAETWTDAIITDREPPEGAWTILSIDHGMRQGRLRIGLSAWNIERKLGIRWLTGELLAEVRGSSANEVDAAHEFINELEMAGIPLDSLDEAVGDRSLQANHGLVVRGNMSIRNAFLQALRMRAPAGTVLATVRCPPELWGISTPAKKSGSPEYRLTEMKRAMADNPPRLLIHRRCKLLPQDMQRWDGRYSAPEKDGLDMFGYAFERAYKHFNLWRG